MTKTKICIVGAGLAGTMAAVLLEQLGYEIHLFEKRSDHDVNSSHTNSNKKNKKNAEVEEKEVKILVKNINDAVGSSSH